MDTCPVCKEFQKVQIKTGTAPDTLAVECARCGRYNTSGTSRQIIGEGKIGDRHLLSAVLRESSERGSPILLRSDDIERLMDTAVVPTNPMALADLLMRRLAQRTSRFSSLIPVLADEDYPLVFGQSARDVLYLLEYLRDVGFMEPQPHTGGKYRITLQGWQHLDRLRQQSPDSSQGFVAMWFDKDLTDAWRAGFEPALRDAGYRALRIDLVHHNEKICDRILAEIRRSGFLVADFTGDRGGVYFEAGFALGLGLAVIWTCREDYTDELHFDTRQFNHIVWSNPADLREKLSDRVVATIGPGGA